MHFDSFKLWWQSFVCLIAFARLGTQCGTSSLNATDPTSVEGTQGEAGKENGIELRNTTECLAAPGCWWAKWGVARVGGFVSLSCHIFWLRLFGLTCFLTFSAPVLNKVSWAEFVAGCRLDESGWEKWTQHLLFPRVPKLESILSQENTIQRWHWCSLEQLISNVLAIPCSSTAICSNLLNSFGQKKISLYTHIPDSQLHRAYLWAVLLVCVFIVGCKVDLNVWDMICRFRSKDSSTMMLQDILAWKSSARSITMCWCLSRNGLLLFMAL